MHSIECGSELWPSNKPTKLIPVRRVSLAGWSGSLCRYNWILSRMIDSHRSVCRVVAFRISRRYFSTGRGHILRARFDATTECRWKSFGILMMRRFYWWTPHNIPEDMTSEQLCCESLKFVIQFYCFWIDLKNLTSACGERKWTEGN
jgi:hypothetical protein